VYSAYKRQRKNRVYFRFFLFVTPFILALVALFWFIFYKSNDSTTNFSRGGAQVAVVKPATKEFKTKTFTISMPTTWELLGKKNPYTNQVYYEFQNKQEGEDNRWLKVYEDVFPEDLPLKRLMPVNIVEGRVIPGTISDECTKFTGAPIDGPNKNVATQTWTAKWQGINFTCDMSTNLSNVSGTATIDNGYGIPFKGSDGKTRKYFFVYIDNNIRPDYQVYSEALKSFQPL
jgi:hypothetical protein